MLDLRHLSHHQLVFIIKSSRKVVVLVKDISPAKHGSVALTKVYSFLQAPLFISLIFLMLIGQDVETQGDPSQAHVFSLVTP